MARAVGQSRVRRAIALALVASAPLGAFAGCARQLDTRTRLAGETGRYALAAERVQESLSSDPADRDYLLGRVRLLLMGLADGQADATEEPANQLFGLLRTQGLNADRTTASVVLSEGVRIWKGEPFEQALAYHYIGVQKAMRGEWDNARAASLSSLFLLRDFSEALGKATPTQMDIARKAAQAERDKTGSGDELLDKGYVAVQSDFAIGYVLGAIANRAIGREDEASDNLLAAVRADPGLQPLADTIRAGSYNTVLVVDAGLGPRKVATGEDGVIAEFVSRTPSDRRGVVVSIDDGQSTRSVGEFPVVQDINQLAINHRWRNLEDVRALKSALGTGLLVGGVAVAAHAKDDQAQLAGLGLALLGGLMKASSKADTRHAELLPQRIYVVPLLLGDGPHTVTLSLQSGDEGRLSGGVSAAGRIVLANVRGPRANAVNPGPVLRYVRMTPIPQGWEQRGQVLWANASWRERVAGDDLPYIFGGRCVTPPSPSVMARYHNAGRLSDLTTVELENLYRAEGIAWTVEDQQGRFRRHVLEGGASLVAPLEGTSGYMRLFAQDHARYQPRSDELRQAREREEQRLPRVPSEPLDQPPHRLDDRRTNRSGTGQPQQPGHPSPLEVARNP